MNRKVRRQLMYKCVLLAGRHVDNYVRAEWCCCMITRQNTDDI